MGDETSGKIYFKKSCGIDLFLSKGESINLTYTDYRIELSIHTTDLPGPGGWQSVCDAVGEWQLSEKRLEMFRAFADRRLPLGTRLPDEYKSWIEEGRIKEGKTIPYGSLPESMRNASQEAFSTLNSLIARTVSCLRWRDGQPGGHNPITSGRLSEYSFDRVNWTPFMGIQVRLVGTFASLGLSKGEIQEFATFAESGGTEPIGRVLYREAWAQRGSNPRSSLVIGMAAAEVGLKDFIVGLQPETKWLAENVPTPPLIQMLTEYLPTLPAKRTFDGKVRQPPQALLDALRKGIRLRNKTVHVGHQHAIDADSLDDVLYGVSDLLWLLDYYSGFDWALSHMRPETLKALANG